jgi:hypothetical protein
MPSGDDYVDLKPGQLGCELGRTVGASLGPPRLDYNGAAFDPAEFVQPLGEGGEPTTPSQSRGWSEKSDGRQFGRLLGARRKRPYEGGYCSNELAPPHEPSLRPGTTTYHIVEWEM